LFNNDKEAATFLGEVFQRADAFLFGRRTYEIFAGSWGTWADPGDSPIWTALTTKPKYVASTTLSDPQWADTTDRPGHAALLRHRPGHRARPGRLASYAQGGDDPRLPAHRAPAVCNRHHVT
jgi:hypothetical protein